METGIISHMSRLTAPDMLDIAQAHKLDTSTDVRGTRVKVSSRCTDVRVSSTCKDVRGTRVR
jgi:hypothetical protein